jgi:hypothetical protein
MARAAKTKPKKKLQKKSALSTGQLRKYNFIASAFLLIQGILVLILSSPSNGTQPITTNFLAKDQLASEAAGHPVLATASHHLFDLNIAYVVAAFFFISALAHLIIATWRRKAYEADLKRGINRARWIEYAFSASTMIVAIALLTGIYDFTSLLMIFVLVAIMSLLGLTMELRNQENKKVDWANYWVGILAGIIPWVVMLIYIWSAHVYGSGVPGFVYWIYGSLFVLFGTFVINMYLQYKRLGHWSTYLYGERLYIILSLIAKTALAWQVFAGTLR